MNYIDRRYVLWQKILLKHVYLIQKKLKEEGYIIDVKFHVSKENRDAARILSGSKIIPRTFYEITDLGLQEYKNFINLILKEYNKQQITEMQEKGEKNYEKDLRIAD